MKLEGVLARSAQLHNLHVQIYCNGRDYESWTMAIASNKFIHCL